MDTSPKGSIPTSLKNLRLFSIVFIVAGICFLSLFAVTSIISAGEKPSGETEAVNLADCTNEGTYCKFEFDNITDQFAAFTVGDGSHGFYFVLSSETNRFAIVCMDVKTFGSHYDSYMYTYGETEDYPGMKTVYGYSYLIEDGLRDLAIQYFNSFMDGSYLDEELFSEYLGVYYLDSTAVPESDTGDKIDLFFGIVFLIGGIVGCFIFKKLKAAKEEQSYGTASVYDDEQPRSRFAAVICMIIGSLLGGAIWVAVGVAGIISGWAAFAVCAFGIYGYKLIYKKVDKFAIVCSVIISVITILASEVISDCLGVVIEINKVNPGRADIISVLKMFPSLLQDSDSLGEFLKNLIIGFLFYIVAAVGFYGKYLKKKPAVTATAGDGESTPGQSYADEADGVYEESDNSDGEDKNSDDSDRENKDSDITDGEDRKDNADE